MLDKLQTFPLDRPAMRAVEIVPARAGEQTVLLVRDPLGLIQGMAALVPDPLLILFMEMADGNTTFGEMAQRATMLSGQIIPAGMFERIAEQLDEALLLQSERFAEALRKKYQAFMDSPVRPYRVFAVEQADRLKMLKELGEEMRRHRMSSLSPPERLDLAPGSVVAILSPHIDYQRGGVAYAWAYRALKECGTGARTFIILGTSHRGAGHRFIATRKNYDTPFGQVETDQALLDELAREFGGELYEEEYLHADEHTIELQAVYLKHIYGDTPIKIVPILVSSIEDMLAEETTPREDNEVSRFCAALRTVLDRHGDSVALIGGVDLSHCGPQFGHEELNDEAREKEIEQHDLSMLQTVEKGDPEGFFDHFRETMNATNVCSIAPIYVVMEVMKGRATARRLIYQQSNTGDRSNLVSFTSMAFVKNGTPEQAPKSRIILVKR